jgi:hypothetical protein
MRYSDARIAIGVLTRGMKSERQIGPSAYMVPIGLCLMLPLPAFGSLTSRDKRVTSGRGYGTLRVAVSQVFVFRAVGGLLALEIPGFAPGT